MYAVYLYVYSIHFVPPLSGFTFGFTIYHYYNSYNVVYAIQYTLDPVPYTLIPDTLHPIPYTLILDTLHPVPYTLIPDTLYLAPYTLYTYT